MFILFVSTLGSHSLVPKTYPCYILRVYVNQKNLCLLTKKPDAVDVHILSQYLYIPKPTNSSGTRETPFALMLLSTVGNTLRKVLLFMVLRIKINWSNSLFYKYKKSDHKNKYSEDLNGKKRKSKRGTNKFKLTLCDRSTRHLNCSISLLNPLYS